MLQRLLAFTLIFLNLCCNNANQKGLRNPNNLKNMQNEESLTLKVGAASSVTLESRGAMGLQLLYRSDDSSVVEITRVESNEPDASKTTRTNIGGPVPAVFEIRALKTGKTKVVFYETRSWEKDFKEIVQKVISIEVNP
jgi:predicted secreted protein